jgi:hypothetical protein
MYRISRNAFGAKIVLLAILGSAIAFAYAAHPLALPVSVDATAVPFDDEPDAVAVDLRLGSRLTLVLHADVPTLGQVIVANPAHAAEAIGPFDRLDKDTALGRAGIFRDAHTGIVILHEARSVNAVRNLYADRLHNLGFAVSRDGQVLHATDGDLTYRVVFGLDVHDGDDVVRVYLGR